jgi:hypothetical protein
MSQQPILQTHPTKQLLTPRPFCLIGVTLVKDDAALQQYKRNGLFHIRASCKELLVGEEQEIIIV